MTRDQAAPGPAVPEPRQPRPDRHQTEPDRPDQQPRETLLVVNSVTGACRRDLLGYARDRGVRVVLAAAKAGWELAYCDAVLDIRVNDYDNMPETVRAVVEFARAQRVDGIVATSDSAGPVMAEAAAELGLSAVTPEVTRTLRDKHAMRRRFDELGLPSAAYALTRDLAQAREAVAAIGLPAVLKPTVGTGSAGVIAVREEHELESAYAAAQAAARDNYGSGSVLVESYLAGPEVCADAIVVDGEIVFHSVTDSPMAEHAGGFGDLELVTPSVLPAGTQARIEDVHRRLVRGLGLRDAVTHTQMRVTGDGPRLVEIHARPAGQRVPQIVRRAHGVDLTGAAVDIALGRRPAPRPEPNGYACYRALCPDRSGVVRSVSGLEEAAAMPGVTAVELAARPGTYIPTAPYSEQEDIAYVYATGDTWTQARERAGAALQAIRVEVD